MFEPKIPKSLKHIRSYLSLLSGFGVTTDVEFVSMMTMLVELPAEMTEQTENMLKFRSGESNNLRTENSYSFDLFSKRAASEMSRAIELNVSEQTLRRDEAKRSVQEYVEIFEGEAFLKVDNREDLFSRFDFHQESMWKAILWL